MDKIDMKQAHDWVGLDWLFMLSGQDESLLIMKMKDGSASQSMHWHPQIAKPSATLASC